MGLIVLLFLIVAVIIGFIVWKEYKGGKKVDEVGELKKTLEEHLKKEAEEDIRMGKTDERIASLVTEQGHLFNQTSTLFTKMDNLDTKFDTKIDNLAVKMDARFDTLTKILLEKK